MRSAGTAASAARIASTRASADSAVSSTATVYYDHPVHTPEDHTLNIDFANPGEGPSQRVAVELTAQSALALVDAIQAALAAVPAELTGLTADTVEGLRRRQLSA